MPALLTAIVVVALAILSLCHAQSGCTNSDDICCAEKIEYPAVIAFDNSEATSEDLPLSEPDFPEFPNPPYLTIFVKFVATTNYVDLIVKEFTSSIATSDFFFLTSKLYELQTSDLEGCSSPDGPDLLASLAIVAQADGTACTPLYNGTRSALPQLYGVKVNIGSTYFLAVGGQVNYPPDAPDAIKEFPGQGSGTLSVKAAPGPGLPLECGGKRAPTDEEPPAPTDEDPPAPTDEEPPTPTNEKPESRARRPEDRSREPEDRSREPEDRSREPENRSRESRGNKHRKRRPKPGRRSPRGLLSSVQQ